MKMIHLVGARGNQLEWHHRHDRIYIDRPLSSIPFHNSCYILLSFSSRLIARGAYQSGYRGRVIGGAVILIWSGDRAGIGVDHASDHQIDRAIVNVESDHGNASVIDGSGNLYI